MFWLLLRRQALHCIILHLTALHPASLWLFQDIVACAQLGRLAVGGYFVLRCDFATLRNAALGIEIRCTQAFEAV